MLIYGQITDLGAEMLVKAWRNSISPIFYRTSGLMENKDLYVVEAGYNRVPEGLRATRLRSAYILHYVISGKGTLNGQEFSKGDVYVVVPEEREYIIADQEDPYETAWIRFQGEQAKILLDSVGIACKNHVFTFDGTEQCANMIRKVVIHEDFGNQWEETLALQALLYQVFSCHARIYNSVSLEKTNGKAISRQDKKNDNQAQDAAYYMEQNYSRPITMQKVAAYVNFTENYLCSVFKKKYGVPPRQYLVNYRIEMARHILKTSPELSISEVAESCGFNDPLYFTRVFHKKTGLTPTDYRRADSE